MAYFQDPSDGALVIQGWENGIAPNPYDGISDARNILINSVPGEVGVGFSTGSLALVVSAGTVTSVSGTICTFTGSAELPAGEAGFAITFGTVSGYSGITAGTTVYWITKIAANTFSLSPDFPMSAGSLITVTGSGNAGYTVYAPDFSNYQGNQPQKFARSTQTGHVFVQDSKGLVWSDLALTTSGYWRYIGNVAHSGSFIGDASNGNGIVYYQSLNSSTTGYFFIFSDSSIDYWKDSSNPAIKYGWRPDLGTNNNSSPYLWSGGNTGSSHDSLVGQDNTVYYCDSSYIGSFFEKPTVTFNPLDTTTYTFAGKNGASTYALKLPAIDSANCLAELGINLLVGGTRNLIYPWDRVSTSFTYPIWLSESVVHKMITINTLAYIFVGNRGRIHVTNGTNAQEWLKVPDHLSGTVEPYYIWGGVAANKNQLYFSVLATENNAAIANTNYGAVWGVDIIKKSLRVVNQMSYGSYAGMATALYAITPLYSGGQLVGNPTGAGLNMGWCSGAFVSGGFPGGSTSGIDKTTSTPFTNSVSYIDSDLIPIGSFDKPKNFNRIEYLLTKPLVSGESIKLQYRTDFSQSYTDIATDSTAGHYSFGWPLPFSNVQWVQIRAVLNSTTSSPSYVRLRHIRLTQMQGTQMPVQQ